MRVRSLTPLLAVAGALGYRGIVSGALTVDVGLGRTVRPLGPYAVIVRAPREVVFDVIAGAYLRTPRAMADKIQVLERGSDMVLAAHRTPVRGALVATTVETVRLTRPSRVDFRVVRGPVPHVIEHFDLQEGPDGSTRLLWEGELGTDFWAAGRWWGDIVATRWAQAVRESFAAVAAEAEGRARR